MLTWAFILTLILAEMGGGGTTQIIVQAETEALCKSIRRAIMTQLADANGHASVCRKLTRAVPIQPEVD